MFNIGDKVKAPTVPHLGVGRVLEVKEYTTTAHFPDYHKPNDTSKISDEKLLYNGWCHSNKHSWYELVETPVESEQYKGGPSSYYDFDEGWVTLNDCMEWLSKNRWKEYSLHFKDLMKACFRFGAKESNDLEYDVNKIIYSGLRLLVMLKGKEHTASYLKKLSEDPQFKGDKK